MQAHRKRADIRIYIPERGRGRTRWGDNGNASDRWCTAVNSVLIFLNERHGLLAAETPSGYKPWGLRPREPCQVLAATSKHI